MSLPRVNEIIEETVIGDDGVPTVVRSRVLKVSKAPAEAPAPAEAATDAPAPAPADGDPES